MTRPTESIKWLDFMASKPKAKCPEELLDVLAARQLLAYIKELEDDIEARIARDEDGRYEANTRS